MRPRHLVVSAALMALAAAVALPVRAQLPFAAAKSSGQTVTPAFEGWYRNPDGTFSLSFGYFNRNAEEVVDIPIGPNNFIEPGDQNQGQPTEFQPRRHWGVFAVKVPADFGDEESDLDAEVPRRRRTRFPAACNAELADRRARGRSRIRQHAAGAEVRRERPGRQRPVRDHRRSAHRDGRQAAHAHRLGARRRQGAAQRRERRPRRRAGDARRGSSTRGPAP